MKVIITLESIPFKMVIEGSDEEMGNMVDVIAEAMIKMKKIWLSTILHQAKLKVEMKKK